MTLGRTPTVLPCTHPNPSLAGYTPFMRAARLGNSDGLLQAGGWRGGARCWLPARSVVTEAQSCLGGASPSFINRKLQTWVGTVSCLSPSEPLSSHPMPRPSTMQIGLLHAYITKGL